MPAFQSSFRNQSSAIACLHNVTLERLAHATTNKGYSPASRRRAQVGVLNAILLGLECIISLQATNKRLKILCEERDLVILFLIDMNHFRFTGWTTFPVVQTKHIVTGGRTISKVDADWGITPLVNPEAATKLAAQRVYFIAPYGIETVDRNMIVRRHRLLCCA